MAVLVVEDDPLVRLTLCEFLEDAGLDVLEAADAAAALGLLAALRHEITVLVTDLDLGWGENGLVLAAKARQLRRGLRVIYETGSPEMLRGHRLRPWERAFVKPFDAGRLAEDAAALDRALGQTSPVLSGGATSPP